MVGHARVHRRDPGDVYHHHPRPVRAYSAQQLLSELAGALRVDDADDRQDQQALAHLQHWRGQLADCLLLLADDPLALLDEAHRHRVGNTVRRRLVGVQDAVEQLEIALVLGEQRSRQHVAEQQHDPHHLVGLDPPRDDALGEVARIRMQRLERPRLQRLDVVVVYGSGLGKDFLPRHRGQELGVRDAPRPLLAQLGAVLAQMRNQFAEQVFFVGLFHGEPPSQHR